MKQHKTRAHLESSLKLAVIKHRRLLYVLALLTVILGLANSMFFLVDSNFRHLLVGAASVSLGTAYLVLINVLYGGAAA